MITWVAFTAITASAACLVVASCRKRSLEVARITRHLRVRADLPPWLAEQFTRADFVAWELEIRSEERQP